MFGPAHGVGCESSTMFLLTGGATFPSHVVRFVCRHWRLTRSRSGALVQLAVRSCAPVARRMVPRRLDVSQASRSGLRAGVLISHHRFADRIDLGADTVSSDAAAGTIRSRRVPWQNAAQDRATWQSLKPAFTARVLCGSLRQLAPVPHGRHMLDVEALRRNLLCINSCALVEFALHAQPRSVAPTHLIRPEQRTAASRRKAKCDVGGPGQ